MNIRIIVASIGTEVLFTRRTPYDDRENQVVSRPFVVLVRSRDVHGQRRPPFIDQNVNLASAFGPIGRIFARILSAQRRGTRFTIGRLPLPSDVPLASIETDQRSERLLPDSSALPGLEALVQHAARNAEPVAMHCFPLTARPKDVPNPVDDRTIVGWRATGPSFLWLLGQMFLDASPQGTGDAKVIHI